MNKENKEDMLNEEKSTEQEVQSEQQIEDSAEDLQEKSDDKELSEVEELKAKNEELNDKFLRLYSEFDNFRKRTAKEKLELYKTAGEDIFAALIPVLDDFERAMKSINEAQDVKSVQDGIKLIHQKFEKALEQKGLKAMDSSVGKEFDVNYHEAITKIPAPEKKLKGKVIDEIERGYTLNDKVIRYTKVVIGE